MVGDVGDADGDPGVDVGVDGEDALPADIVPIAGGVAVELVSRSHRAITIAITLAIALATAIKISLRRGTLTRTST
jgi:hypothetical protein